MLDWTPWRPLGRPLDKHVAPLQCYMPTLHAALCAAWSAAYSHTNASLLILLHPEHIRAGRLKREAMLDHWSQRGFQAWQDNYLKSSRCPTFSGDRRGRDPNCPLCWSISAYRCGLLTNQEIGYNQSWLLIPAKATLWLGFMMRLPSCSAAYNQFLTTCDLQMHFIISQRQSSLTNYDDWLPLFHWLLRVGVEDD